MGEGVSCAGFKDTTPKKERRGAVDLTAEGGKKRKDG